MGAYLSEPVTEKHSSEDSSDTLVVGASSMQGWRVNQEDAHNTILTFDKGMQLFAVYDGHGGAEVATYCSQKLPDFIRECEAYKKGDLEEALKQAFLDLDSSLTKEEVVAELCKLAGHNESDVEDEDENVVANLRQEASMPLEDLMAKYQSNAPLKKVQAADGKSPLSPLIRRSGGSGSAGCSSSTGDSGPSCSGGGGSSSAGPGSSGAGPSSSGAGSSGEASSSSGAGSSSEAKNATPGGSSSDAGASNSSSAVSSSVSAEEGKENEAVPDPSKSVKKEEEDEEETKSKEAQSITKESNGQSEEKDVKPQVNGDVPHIKEETGENADAVSSTTENSALKNGKLHEEEETKPKGKGKAKDKTKSIKKEDEEVEEKKPARTRNTPIRKLSSMHVLKFLTGGDISDSEEESDDDEEDTSFEGRFDSSEDEEDGEGEGEEDDEEDDEDEEDFEDTDSEDENDPIMKMTGVNEVPGADSGCTAVVALLRGRDLFVANAGDSRCVVCRNGKAIDMSLDHKPEDAPELARILKAGGQVTCDGRVNGGLNLSRAIGDHAYKQGKDIEATEQMITALPDIRTLRIDPKQDDFMVLACDGIWNFMSSQDVCDFVRTRLVDKKMKPAKICEELFDHCLSPNTMGDGTGCDNMTAVIVQFQPALEKEPSTLERETILESPITNETSKKGDETAEDVDVDKEKEKEEEEDCQEEDETKEKMEEDGKEVVAKKRPSESSENDTEGNLSPKQKKVKVDSDSEANGVQV